MYKMDKLKKKWITVIAPFTKKNQKNSSAIKALMINSRDKRQLNISYKVQK